MTTTFVIEGAAVRDIPSLYDELNRVLMEGEVWQLGESLDALDESSSWAEPRSHSHA